jgi:exonuclease III
MAITTLFGCSYNEPEIISWWSPLTKARERNNGWRIDYFFVNKRFGDNVRSATILPEVQGSDRSWSVGHLQSGNLSRYKPD